MPTVTKGWWRIIAIGVTAALVVTAVLFELTVATGPDVSSAAEAVVAIDAAHGTEPQEINPTDRIAAALVAAEDDGFYTNNGIDVPALIRSAWGFVQGSDTGGSTIEMQLAHMLYPTRTAGFWGRVHRVSLAVELDTHYAKASILSMYLSAAYFGHGFYGIRAASIGYFDTAPSELSWTQAAMLAGLVQAPSSLDPLVHPASAAQRMDYVLSRLVADNQLTAAQAGQVVSAPLGLVSLQSPAWSSR